MANQERIRVARGTWDKVKGQIPPRGNPVWDTTNNMLYIGDNVSELNGLQCICTDRLIPSKNLVVNAENYIASNHVVVDNNGVSIKGRNADETKMDINIDGKTFITGKTSIVGATNIQGSTVITGTTSISSKLTVQTNGIEVTSGNLDVKSGAATISGGLNIGGSITLGGNLTTNTGRIEAVYFNATSDRRLKEDIFDTKVNALDIVNSVDIKEYNFIDGNKERQIGLIAQDLLEQDKDKFFIDDSGEYLKVKENKLIYLLWKAVQELSNRVR